MPLVRFIGGTSPSDNTEVIRLNPDEEGFERLLLRGDPEFKEVTGDELRAIASAYEVEIKPDEDEDPAVVSDSPRAPIITGTGTTPQSTTFQAGSPPSSPRSSE